MGSPVASLILFVCLAVGAVLLAIPALRSVPGFEKQLCKYCETLSPYNVDTCTQCGKALEAPDDEDDPPTE